MLKTTKWPVGNFCSVTNRNDVYVPIYEYNYHTTDDDDGSHAVVEILNIINYNPDQCRSCTSCCRTSSIIMHKYKYIRITMQRESDITNI